MIKKSINIKEQINLLIRSKTRTDITKKNTIMSFVIKGLSILINLLLVRITIDYINLERYGIWLTISSLIMWFNFLDFGLGNGLRNKLTEAIAKNDQKAQISLISSAYGAIFMISVCMAIIFNAIIPIINWPKLLGISDLYKIEITQTIYTLLMLFCFQLILQLINTVFNAFQQSAKVSLVYLLGSSISLSTIILLKLTTNGNLFWMSIAYFSGNLFSQALFTLYFFIKIQPKLKPNLKHFSLNNVKKILNLGGKFFIIQIAAIIQFQTTNVLINRLFNPTVVAEYHIAFKLFSVIIMIFGILITPIWSAVTDAKIKGDFIWIKKLERRLLNIWLLFTFLTIFLYYLSPYIYQIWIGKTITVPDKTSLGIMLYAISATYSAIYVNILNGLGRLKTQFYLSILTLAIFIPLTHIMAIDFKLGVFGISISLIIVNVNGIIAAPLEFKYLIKKSLLS